MHHTYVDAKNLEDLAVFLSLGILSLKTLYNTQVQAIKIGIMPEDMNERSNVIAWDLRRLMGTYQKQLESTLELLPDNFNAQESIEKLKKEERAMRKEK